MAQFEYRSYIVEAENSKAIAEAVRKFLDEGNTLDDLHYGEEAVISFYVSDFLKDKIELTVEIR